MKRTFKAGLFLFSVVLFAGGCGKNEPATHTEHTEHTDARSHSAPTFTLTDHAGKTHALADYTGKVVVLEWINPECPFVVRHYEADTMVNLAAAYAEKGVVWLGINTTSHFDHTKNRAFAEKYGVPYPILDDSDGTVGKLYGATRTPEMVVIDAAQKIVYHGAIDDDPRSAADGDARSAKRFYWRHWKSEHHSCGRKPS